MNVAIIIGNLTKDPETRYTQNQTAVCKFTVAVNEKKKNPQTGEWEDRASFIPVTVWGRQAENCDKFLRKGSKCAVNGRIQTGSYTNREGQKVYTTDVIANSVEFLRENSSNGGGFGERREEPRQEEPRQEAFGGFAQIEDAPPF